MLSADFFLRPALAALQPCRVRFTHQNRPSFPNEAVLFNTDLVKRFSNTAGNPFSHGILHVESRIPNSPSRTLHSPFRIPQSTHSALRTPHSTHSEFRIPNSALRLRDIPHSTHSAFRIPHSAFEPFRIRPPPPTMPNRFTCPPTPGQIKRSPPCFPPKKIDGHLKKKPKADISFINKLFWPSQKLASITANP